MGKVRNNIKSQKYLPFLKYPGGKRWLLNSGIEFYPESIRSYHEPFLGSGSTFFYLKGRNLVQDECYLNDLNKDLINSYEQLKNNYNSLRSKLCTYQNNSQFYYKIRSSMPEDTLDKACRFIYLNRTCFGGLHRVNKSGQFNVPYSNRTNQSWINYKTLELCNLALLERTNLCAKHFADTISNVRQNDFVFLDPPYTGSEVEFNRYNSTHFSKEDERKLFDYLTQLISIKANFVLFFGGNKELLEKFGSFGTTICFERTSNLSLSMRKKVQLEYIVKNF